MKKPLFALPLLGLGLSLPVWGADAQLQLTLPSVSKRPYVAVWVEKATNHEFAGNVAVWYDQRPHATKWLPDLRSWWKVSGSQASLPIDGVSGATRPAGEHTINLGSSAAFKKLAPGDYEIVVEVSRERGGHDLVRLPMQWPPRSPQQTEAEDVPEVSQIKLTLKP